MMNDSILQTSYGSMTLFDTLLLFSMFSQVMDFGAVLDHLGEQMDYDKKAKSEND